VKVNIHRVELVEALDEPGFRHVGTMVGPLVGSRRIQATVYGAEAGIPIWPYHYHHGVEEWLYVIEGAPVLRGPAGEQVLAAGDLVCFPSGYGGAHTVKGPGRFVIFATGEEDGPYMCVYPDSDKISCPAGILLRSSAVGYWHGEGDVSEPGEADREPDSGPPQPVANVVDSQGVRGERLEVRVADIEPGASDEPYHSVFGREEWLLVLAGTPTVRRPGGEEVLGPGDLVCFVEGPAGAREVLNGGASVARVLLLTTTGLPANVHYPETGEWLLRNGPGREEMVGGTPSRPAH
jgi:uncharacterized cupin superfamily protein